MTPQRLTADEVAKAVYEAKGLASIAAKRLGCDPKTVRNFAQRYPTVRDAIVQAREDLKDFAESKLLQAIDAGEIVPILFYLKTQAKDRGYVERSEVTGADGGPLHIIEVELGKPAGSAASTEPFDGDASAA
jgi:hypothetical protein